MFIVWQFQIDLAIPTGLMQLALLLSQSLFSVSCCLRAVDAIKHARAQLSDVPGGVEVGDGAPTV